MKRFSTRQPLFRWCLSLALCGTFEGCQSPHVSSIQRAPLSPRSTSLALSSDRPTFPSPVTKVASSSDPEEAAEILAAAFLDADLPPAAAPPNENADSPGWSIDRFESMALSYNPAIQQATASAHKAMGFRDQVGRKPNPFVGYNATQIADQRTDQHIAFIEQDFVTADKLCKNETVLNQEVQSQLWEVETQRQRVLTDVRVHFYAALAAQRRFELANEFEMVVQKGVTTAQARFDAKEGSRTDILQSEIQLRQVQVQRQQADAALRAAWKQLVTVAGVPEQQPQPLDGQLPNEPVARDWDQVGTEILSASPELQGARSRLARAQANIDRQEAQSTPNLSFMLAAGRDNGTGSGLINAQVGMPIPFHNANEGNISAAHAEMCRASRNVERTQLAIQSRLAETRGQYESAIAAVETYRIEILPRAVETLKLVEQAHAGGEFDFVQVLVARRTYFDANLEYVQAQSDLAQATCLLDGLLLTGGLDDTRDTEFDSSLRDQTLSGQ
ncbi:MAG: TolC family protein [Planctomycetota bacterium]|nr:MAG: TolC family protein [Planctomycetota bacterium]